MIGRIVGVVAGAAIAVTGYGMLKPAIFARYFDFSKLSLGPFSEYHTLVCWMIVAIGGAVILASLQRPSGGASSRKTRSVPAMFAPSEPEHGPAPMNFELDEPETDHATHRIEEAQADAPEPAHRPVMDEFSSPSRPSPSPLW
jgi:hypothetical protein